MVFSKDNSKVLLAQRKSESDYDSTYSFIGGKMETTDKNIVEEMRREKNEEVGEYFKIRLNPIYNSVTYFVKKDGNFMLLPHYYAQYLSGEVKLNGEYSNYKWVSISEIQKLEPKIPNIPEIVNRLLKLLPVMKYKDFVEL